MTNVESEAEPRADESEIPDLGPVPTRIEVGAGVVRRLIADQFPAWSGLPIRPVATAGWDNRTFHLGDEFLVRVPSAAEYALAVDKEHRWLPVLGPRLPLPIPEPVGKGAPGRGYPYSWSVYRWLPGEQAGPDSIADLTDFAIALAGFLAALRAIDPTDGPGPGLHNWYRGGTLLTYARQVEQDLAALADRPWADDARALWDAALAATWDGDPVWFHGDIAAGNLLVHEGSLSSVIDFGTSGVGDPACDLAIAWTLLDEPSRAAFRDRLSVDPETWARGRGWALWKALSGCAGAVRTGSDAPDSHRTLNELLTHP